MKKTVTETTPVQDAMGEGVQSSLFSDGVTRTLPAAEVSDMTQNEFEQQVLTTLRALPPVVRNAFYGALDARPERRYQAALVWLTEYEQPEQTAEKVAALAALLVESQTPESAAPLSPAALTALAENVDAGDLLNRFAKLPSQQQSEVMSTLCNVEEWVANPAAGTRYIAADRFRDFVQCLIKGEDVTEFRKAMGYTREEATLLLQAWETVERIEQAARARHEARFAPAGTSEGGAR